MKRCWILKAAGWDAVFVSGRAETPQYLMITDDKIELKDAAPLWGKDTVETEIAIQTAGDDKKIRTALILLRDDGTIEERGEGRRNSPIEYRFPVPGDSQ